MGTEAPKIIQLKNGQFLAEISPLGAELQKFEKIETGFNYIYCKTTKEGEADDREWKRSSPILFPNIDMLAYGKLVHQENEYEAKPHGFARDKEFEVLSADDSESKFVLNSNDEIKKVYPFDFSLSVTYKLEKNVLSVTFKVENKSGEDPMCFSIGAHPAFKLADGTKMENYKVEFDKPIVIKTSRGRGRYLTERVDFISEDATNNLPLSRNLFEQDSIILEDTGVEEVKLHSEDGKYRLWMEFKDFPVFALWTELENTEDKPFVCIEPWCGIGAYCNEKKDDISRKLRVTKLKPNDSFERTYKIGIE